MDPLLQIADAVVADLASIKDALSPAFDVEREYVPTWDPARKPESENSKPKVYVSAVAEESDLATRDSTENNVTVQIVIGAWTQTRAAADAVCGLQAAIAARYRKDAHRRLTYDNTTLDWGIVTAVNRVAVYDAEQFRAGLTIGAVNLLVRYWE